MTKNSLQRIVLLCIFPLVISTGCEPDSPPKHTQGKTLMTPATGGGEEPTEELTIDKISKDHVKVTPKVESALAEKSVVKINVALTQEVKDAMYTIEILDSAGEAVEIKEAVTAKVGEDITINLPGATTEEVIYNVKIKFHNEDGSVTGEPIAVETPIKVKLEDPTDITEFNNVKADDFKVTTTVKTNTDKELVLEFKVDHAKIKLDKPHYSIVLIGPDKKPIGKAIVSDKTTFTAKLAPIKKETEITIKRKVHNKEGDASSEEFDSKIKVPAPKKAPASVAIKDLKKEDVKITATAKNTDGKTKVTFNIPHKPITERKLKYIINIVDSNGEPAPVTPNTTTLENPSGSIEFAIVDEDVTYDINITIKNKEGIASKTLEKVATVDLKAAVDAD